MLDDRSLNGIFVNGERVEWGDLADGDELIVGRYRLFFLDNARARRPLARAEPAAGRVGPFGARRRTSSRTHPTSGRVTNR